MGIVCQMGDFKEGGLLVGVKAVGRGDLDIDMISIINKNAVHVLRASLIEKVKYLGF